MPIDCYQFGLDFRLVQNPNFDHFQGAMTYWSINEYPMIIGGYGFEVESYDGDEWKRLPDIPGQKEQYSYFEFHTARV